MEESETSQGSNSNTENSTDVQAERFPWLPVSLMLGVIVILIVFILNALVPKTISQPLQLEQNRAKWENQNITHYQLSIDVLGYGFYRNRLPLKVEVKAGKIISVVDSLGNNLSPAKDPEFGSFYPEVLTIPGLFSYTYRIMLDKPPAMHITYDPDLGYPQEVYVDPYTEPCCQDFTITIKNFQVLP
jgi:hypothetical protein